MKRIAILTAGGDTPALNATIAGAVTRANSLQIRVFGIIKGFSGLLNPQFPHLELNPLFHSIPELNPCLGGTILGASRTYVDGNDKVALDAVAMRLKALKIDGLICIGGDGTINGMQPLADYLPVVLAPKTIDNDLGLNYPDEANEWIREADDAPGKPRYRRVKKNREIELDEIINYATPGYATAVYVAATGIERIRTTAESHRRIAIIEVMGRDSGYIALGSAYGQPDIILLPEYAIDLDSITTRVKELYDLQKHVVMVVGEGVVTQDGTLLGDEMKQTDPSGKPILSGASEVIRNAL
ncbi:MAG: 6-phosphofructokinase, partial [Planctomycetota bacterium]|nr:6-phosphofructokinase [Planctomycetota bacterium]